jgi:very-short-patch-repair endonuclease
MESRQDAARDAWLRERGYRVLRFWNHEVLGNVEGVVATIVARLEAKRSE